MNYLEMAKAAIKATNGEHPVHETQCWCLIAIAYALIDIAEKLRGDAE
jgi:hypothetical protein